MSINKHNGMTIQREKIISIPKLRAAEKHTVGIWSDFQNFKQGMDCFA
jgi:hypothetical protein